MDIVEIIKALKDNGLTGYKIAEDTGLSQVGIDKILSGSSKKPQLKTIKVLESYIKNNFTKTNQTKEERYLVSEKFTESDFLKVKLQAAEDKIASIKKEKDMLLDKIDLLIEKLEFYETKNETQTSLILEKLNTFPIEEIIETHQLMTRSLLLEKLEIAKRNLNDTSPVK